MRDAELQPRSQKRAVHGIVLLDKAAGITSNRALQRVKRIFAATKAGHTGSLDPFATGMLPICLGSATKVSAYLLSAAKEYQVRVVLGVRTDTADVDGQVVEERAAAASSRDRVVEVLESFVGASLQVPPMHSALKHEGRRLYTLARAGIEVERRPRPIRVDWIRLEALEWPVIEFAVRCSKGTYIRSLAVDLAERLGTVGFVAGLRRLAVDPFEPSALVTEARLEAAAAEGGFDALDRFLVGADLAMPQFPVLRVGAEAQSDLVHGRAVSGLEIETDGLIRVYGPDETFIGLAEADPDGRLHPRRIFLS